MPKCCSYCINKNGFKRQSSLDVKNKIKVWSCKDCGQIILKGWK